MPETNNDVVTATATATATATHQDLTDREQRLDHELRLIRKMRLAFASTLHMLEAARDSMVELGDRMERLQTASELCRTTLEEKKVRDQEADRMQLEG